MRKELRERSRVVTIKFIAMQQISLAKPGIYPCGFGCDIKGEIGCDLGCDLGCDITAAVFNSIQFSSLR